MSEWIDLSIKIKLDNLVYPGDEKPKIQKLNSMEIDGFNLSSVTMNMHIGTHIDFKNHVTNKPDSPDFTYFMGKANLVRPKIIDNVISTLSIESQYFLQKYQEKILLLDLNHSRKFNTKDYYNQPKFEPSIFNFLRNNNIKLLGADLPSFAYQDEKNLKMHKDLLKSDVYLLENLTNMGKLTEHVYLIALPLDFENVEASLVRAVAKNM
jgi:arylformamidase